MMCEQMGTTPLEEEIPLDYSDLSDECQIVLAIFNILPDSIGGMSGAWLGKDYSGLRTFMDIYGIQDEMLFLNLLTVLVQETSDHYAKKQKEQQQKSKLKGRK